MVPRKRDCCGQINISCHQHLESKTLLISHPIFKSKYKKWKYVTSWKTLKSNGMNRQQWNQNKKPFFFLIKCFDVEFLFGEMGGILAFVVKSSKSLSQSANIQDIRRIPTRLKIATGTYILQKNRAIYSKHLISATCNLCCHNYRHK
jgi:hypothetical protein